MTKEIRFDLECLCNFGAHLPFRRRPPQSIEPGPVGDAIERAVVEAIEGAPGPVAVALSGGVDSTIVAAAAIRAGHRLRAFTLDTGRAAREAADVASTLGLALTRVPLPRGGIRGTSPADVVSALGQPTHSGAPFGFLPLYRALAEQGISTVITGDGADETFAGHAYHRRPPTEWSADIWTTWRAVRRLGVDTPALLRLRRVNPWTASPAATQIAAEARAIGEPAERLRWLDVRLRREAQCVDLQRALATSCGLVYRAPLSDARVTERALALPVEPARPKWPLVDLAAAWLGRPWAREKQAMFTPTGGQAPDDPWTRWLGPEITERHGLFEPAEVARLSAAVTGHEAWLPRALVVVATTHAGLELGVFDRDQFRGASSSK